MYQIAVYITVYFVIYLNKAAKKKKSPTILFKQNDLKGHLTISSTNYMTKILGQFTPYAFLL